MHDARSCNSGAGSLTALRRRKPISPRLSIPDRLPASETFAPVEK
jgi:hypothetical protein